MGEGKGRSLRGEGKIGNSAKKGIKINKVIINKLASDWKPGLSMIIALESSRKEKTL